MDLVCSGKISLIDAYATEVLGISSKELMLRSAKALASPIRERFERGAKVVIFAGSGNNGGDGYALAYCLSKEYVVRVIDVFGKGQRSEEGNFYLEASKKEGVVVEEYSRCDDQLNYIKNADVCVDAILGVGAKMPFKDPLPEIGALIDDSLAKFKLAADVPLGIDPDSGERVDFAPRFDMTVSLSFPKTGQVSYPAKEIAGEIVMATLDLPKDIINFVGGKDGIWSDSEFVKNAMPKRPLNSNKSDFGRLVVITGSEKYMGAAALNLASALRGGAGYVEYMGEEEINKLFMPVYPEVIYTKRPSFSNLSDDDVSNIVKHTSGASAILLGSGAGISVGLQKLVSAFINSEGAPILLDADAINVLGELVLKGDVDISAAKRRIILTPHPGEFSRLTSISIPDIQKNRLNLAKEFANKWGVTLVLKGAATVICGNGELYINSSGTSALSKAGSGDCLAGFIASLIASAGEEKSIPALCAVAVYLHGKAADDLEREMSPIGITPSDLPVAMVRALSKALK